MWNYIETTDFVITCIALKHLTQLLFILNLLSLIISFPCNITSVFFKYPEYKIHLLYV